MGVVISGGEGGRVGAEGMQKPVYHMTHVDSHHPIKKKCTVIYYLTAVQ